MIYYPLLLVGLLLLQIQSRPQKAKVLTLTSSNFEQACLSNKYLIVNFYASDCQSCQ